MPTKLKQQHAGGEGKAKKDDDKSQQQSKGIAENIYDFVPVPGKSIAEFFGARYISQGIDSYIVDPLMSKAVKALPHDRWNLATPRGKSQGSSPLESTGSVDQSSVQSVEPEDEPEEFIRPQFDHNEEKLQKLVAENKRSAKNIDQCIDRNQVSSGIRSWDFPLSKNETDDRMFFELATKHSKLQASNLRLQEGLDDAEGRIEYISGLILKNEGAIAGGKSLKRLMPHSFVEANFDEVHDYLWVVKWGVMLD